jgi:hypothetical protein
MASAEAVERRRQNRRARTRAKQYRAVARAEGPPQSPMKLASDLRTRQRRAVQRLVHRHFGDEPPDLIVLEYDYWLLRSMGCDVLAREFRWPQVSASVKPNTAKPLWIVEERQSARSRTAVRDVAHVIGQPKMTPNENGIFRLSLPTSAIACEKTRMSAKDCKRSKGR